MTWGRASATRARDDLRERHADDAAAVHRLRQAKASQRRLAGEHALNVNLRIERRRPEVVARLQVRPTLLHEIGEDAVAGQDVKRHARVVEAHLELSAERVVRRRSLQTASDDGEVMQRAPQGSNEKSCVRALLKPKGAGGLQVLYEDAGRGRVSHLAGPPISAARLRQRSRSGGRTRCPAGLEEWQAAPQPRGAGGAGRVSSCDSPRRRKA